MTHRISVEVPEENLNVDAMLSFIEKYEEYRFSVLHTLEERVILISKNRSVDYKSETVQDQ